MLIAAVGQESKCTKNGRTLSGPGAFEADKRDHQESDNRGKNANQDGY